MEEIAIKLYEMCEDMEHRDFSETKEKDIKNIASDLETLPEDSTLLLCINQIIETY